MRPIKEQKTMASPNDEWLEALPYPVFGLSDAYEFIFVNYAAEVFFERSRHFLLKTKLTEFFLEDSPVFALLRRLSHGMQSVGDQELSLVSPRIGKKLVNLQVAKPSGNSGFIVSVQMREMADQLRGQSLSKGAALSMSKMTSLLAHEIKNPLAGIKGAAQLIELDANDEQEELAQVIVEEVDRIAELLDRIENVAGSGKLNFASVNVHEILQHVITVTQASFGRHVTINRQFDPSLPSVMADKSLLIQAVMNLLKNACEACDGAGVIEVITSYSLKTISSSSAKNKEAYLPLQIDIIDNGKGIPDHLRDILFEPFISDKTDGSGLGLAVVASAIADHQGVVSVNSRSGRTHFQILLPMTQTNDPASTHPAPTHPASNYEQTS